MKKLLLIGAAFTALTGPAMAAEKLVRVYKRPRPVVVAASIYNWTGLYGAGTPDIAGARRSVISP